MNVSHVVYVNFIRIMAVIHKIAIYMRELLPIPYLSNCRIQYW